MIIICKIQRLNSEHYEQHLFESLDSWELIYVDKHFLSFGNPKNVVK